jgi:hypothetical protein
LGNLGVSQQSSGNKSQTWPSRVCSSNVVRGHGQQGMVSPNRLFDGFYGWVDGLYPGVMQFVLEGRLPWGAGEVLGDGHHGASELCQRGSEFGADVQHLIHSGRGEGRQSPHQTGGRHSLGAVAPWSRCRSEDALADGRFRQVGDRLIKDEVFAS